MRDDHDISVLVSVVEYHRPWALRARLVGLALLSFVFANYTTYIIYTEPHVTAVRLVLESDVCNLSNAVFLLSSFQRSRWKRIDS